MSVVVVDDHLLADLLAGDASSQLRRLVARAETATTNLYAYRLCRALVAGRGGALTGSWPAEQRVALGRSLSQLPDEIGVVHMADLTFRMAELATAHRLSALGAEALAAAEHLRAQLCVWEGDDGPMMRAAAEALGIPYRTIAR